MAGGEFGEEIGDAEVIADGRAADELVIIRTAIRTPIKYAMTFGASAVISPSSSETNDTMLIPASFNLET